MNSHDSSNIAAPANCAALLRNLEMHLKMMDHNFEAAIVSTCIGIVEREYVVDMSRRPVVTPGERFESRTGTFD
ncbi:MAG: hypothetical protein QE265_08025 [Rhodoferax sp.]|nr:hypothetical protein [Rhodoferax sp.]